MATPSATAKPLAASGGKLSSLRNVLTRERLLRIAREPLLHFLILGGLIFAVSEGIEHYTSQYRVVIGPDRIARISDTFRQQFGQAPTDTQLNTLVDNYVREEIEYRESVALGLDRDDEIVRRRLVQKYEFLQQDLQTLQEPTEQALRDFYAQHKDQYGTAATRSFTQVYFSPDSGGDLVARSRAEDELKKLNASNVARAPDAGDVFPGPSDLAGLTQGDTERLFGASDLSRDVFKAAEGSWIGPVRSGFGWHLIRVTAATPAAPQAFETVADRVRDDWRTAQRTQANDKALAALKGKYTIVLPGAGK